jgi:uncharacterized protein (TIGR03435 family)
MPPGSTIAGGNLNEVTFFGRAMKISYFAGMISFQAGNLPIIDKTGITGFYNIRLKFAPQNLLHAASSAPSEAPAVPSIFKALQEQLGLKLEPGKGTIDYYILVSISAAIERTRSKIGP